MLQLSMKCWNSAFNAQSSRLIIVLVQLGTLNIHLTAVEMLMKKERQGETQFTTKIDSFLSFIPPWMLLYTFSGFFNLTLCMTKLRVIVLYCSYCTDNSISWDWVQLLLSYNGHPVDGALVGAGSLSPICCCTLCGSAGAGTWIASSIIK